MKRDFMNCKHEYVIQTKKGIPSLLPFVCIHCGMGSWFSTVEEEEAHRKEFMDKINKAGGITAIFDEAEHNST